MHVVSKSEQPTEDFDDGIAVIQLAAGEHMSIQYTLIEPGSGFPDHDHTHAQLGYVFGSQPDAELTFCIDGGAETFRVGPGDSYYLPGGETHGTKNESSAAVENINVFHPPRPELDL